MIGFAPKAGFALNADSYKTCGWYMYAYDGTLWAQDSVHGKAYGKTVAFGSVVTCNFDEEKNTISFEVDGQFWGVAYVGVPQGEVYAALSFSNTPNIQIALVE